MKLIDGLVLKEYAGNYVVIAVGNATKVFNGMIQLNETGATIFKGLQENKSAEEITNALVQEFNADFDEAKKDVDEFILSLQEANLLK